MGMNSLATVTTGGAIILSLIVTLIPTGYCDIQSDLTYCGMSCHTDKDCSPSSSGCNKCAYNADIYSNKRVCTTISQICGKPPPAQPRNASLPQYLVIGDSITRALFPQLKKSLGGIVDAYVITGTVETAINGLKCIATWIGHDPNRWDLVSFNFGMWDAAAKKAASGNATYGGVIQNITEYILSKTMNETKVIFVLTTPTPSITACCRTAECRPSKSSVSSNLYSTMIIPCPSCIKLYNLKAKRALSSMFGSKVTIVDLWSWVNRKCCHEEDCSYDYCSIQPTKNHFHNSQCPVYFSDPDGWNYLALNVSATVKNVLNL